MAKLQLKDPINVLMFTFCLASIINKLITGQKLKFRLSSKYSGFRGFSLKKQEVCKYWAAICWRLLLLFFFKAGLWSPGFQHLRYPFRLTGSSVHCIGKLCWLRPVSIPVNSCNYSVKNGCSVGYLLRCFCEKLLLASDSDILDYVSVRVTLLVVQMASKC